MRTYGPQVRKYRNAYNKKHRVYSQGEKVNRRFSWSEMYLIISRKLQGGRRLTDIEIAKILHRSVQSVQLKRCTLLAKWRMGGI